MPSLSAQIGGALAWWREAGVDCDFAETALSWLASGEADVAESPQAAPPPLEIKARPPEPRAQIGGEPAAWPKTIDNFFSWWLAEPSLDGGITERRIAPRGQAGARLMILVEHPEEQDSESLLSGPAGKFAASITAALGLSPDQVYWASALPRHTPMPDWADLAEAGLGKILAHHVALAAPERLLVCSPHVSSLLGHDPAKSAEPLRRFNHEGGSIPALVAPELSLLAAQPKRKARLWRALLEWTGTD